LNRPVRHGRELFGNVADQDQRLLRFGERLPYRLSRRSAWRHFVETVVPSTDSSPLPGVGINDGDPLLGFGVELLTVLVLIVHLAILGAKFRLFKPRGALWVHCPDHDLVFLVTYVEVDSVSEWDDLDVLSVEVLQGERDRVPYLLDIHASIIPRWAEIRFHNQECQVVRALPD